MKYLLIFLLINVAWIGKAQPPPVDCGAAIPVCSSQQLDYNSNGPGNNDFTGANSNSNGCLLNGEHQSAWFQIYISPNSPPGATLAFTISPNAGSGEDYDFALYGPDVDCDNLGTPIRCSYAASTCGFCPETGLGMGTSDFSEGAGGDGFVAEVQTQPGESYILLVDNWLSSNQGFFLDWTGSAVLSCDCVAELTIEGDLEICPGETTTLTATGTDLSTYDWSASNGGNISGPTNTASITATATGTYTVSVTDTENCTAELSVQVTEAPGPEIQSSITPAFCDQNNGIIDLTINGDGSPFSFNWSNGATSEDLQDVSAGSYTVTVTGSNGCSATASLVVPDEDQTIEISGNTEPNTSCDSGNGSVSISVNPPGTYIWSNGASTQEILNLTGGTYTVTVTSQDGCTETASFTVNDIPNLPQASASVTPSNCGLPNGSVDLSVNQGAPPYTFIWSNGATTEDLTDVPEGTYTVTVTGDNGCTSEQSFSVSNVNPPIDISGSVNPNTSCDNPNGSISISVSPSNPNYTYTWSDGSSGTELIDIGSGSYTVTVSGNGSCTSEASFTVEDLPDQPDPTAQTTPSSCDLPNGSIDLVLTGGVSPYTYVWSNGATTEDLDDVGEGNYQVTVTGDNGCTAALSVQLNNQNPPISINPVIVPNTSCDGGNGSISITVSPSGNYNYAWSNGAQGQDIDKLEAGNYTVTVDGTGSCDEIATFNVPNQPNAPSVSGNVTPATCGESNGSIDVSVSGGVSPYVFLWSTGSTSEDLIDVPGGTYALTVTGENGCTDVSQWTVPDNTIDFTIESNITPNTNCTPGSYNGSIAVTVSPSESYTYSWSNGSTGAEINNLAPGTYTLTVSAGGSCTETATYTVPDEPVQPEINETVVVTSCSLPNGAIDLSVNNGVPPYTFSWTDGSTTEDVSGISAGDYTVTVTGENGCSATKTISVPNNDILIDISGNVIPNTSCTNANGVIELYVTPQANYTFTWSNGATTEDIFDLEPGTYSVTVQSGSCMSTASYTVNQDIEQPQITPDIEASTCGEPNANIDLTLSGGNPPYTYSWSNGAMSEDLTNIPAGIYSVTVTDANGCTVSSSYQVQNNSSDFTISGTTQHVSSCMSNNGSIDLSVIPSDNYEFIWSNGENTEDLDSLSPGDYSVTVTQSGNCSASAFFTVEDQTVTPTLDATVNPEYCGQNDGSIDLTVENGTAPYEYQWADGLSSEDRINVSSGVYDITVTDDYGCTATRSYTVPEHNVTFSVDAVILPDTSCAANSGSIELDVTPPSTYTYSWSTGDTTEELSGLSQGSYSVTVSAGDSCRSVEEFTVPAEHPDIELNTTVTDVLCHGGRSGSISLTVDGGTGPYMYAWSPTLDSPSAHPTGLPAGNYQVTVTDVNGCTESTEVTISQPQDSLKVSCSVTSNVSQPGGNDGEGAVMIQGGTPPYAVDWGSGDSSNLSGGSFSIDNLSEGSYQVTVSDANGCVVFCGFIIEVDECETQVGSMDLTVQSECGDGCIEAIYDDVNQDLGPDGELQFIVHHGSGQQIVNEIERNSASRFCFDPNSMNYGITYYVSAVIGPDDSDGNVVLDDPCTKIAAGTPIVFNKIPEVAIASPDSLNCEQQQVLLSGSSNLTDVSYNWSSSGGAILGDPNQAEVMVEGEGIYTLTVTANNCSNSTSVEVMDLGEGIEAQIQVNPGDTIDCTVSTVSLTASSPGTDHPRFAWYLGNDFVSNDQTIATETPGKYTLEVTDTVTWCRGRDSVVIKDNTNYPVLNTNPASALNCRDREVTISGGSPHPDISFSWVRIQGTDTIEIADGSMAVVSEAGTYQLFGLAPNGCRNSDALTVVENVSPPAVSVGEDVTLDCQQNPVEIDASVEEAVSIQWNGPEGGIQSDETGNIITVNKPGIYTVQITDSANYCTNTDTVEVFQYDNVPRANISTQPPTCFGDQNGRVMVQHEPGNGPYQYILDGEEYDEPIISPVAPGIYKLVVEDGQGCTWSTEVIVPEPEPIQANLGENIKVERGETVMIQLETTVPEEALDTILWHPVEAFDCNRMPCLTQEFAPQEESTVRATVIDTNGCRSTDALTIFVEREYNVYVPNIFSPNGDGINDVFMIYGGEDVAQVDQFVLFDRWGERIFERRNFQPGNPNYGWDGTHRGEVLSPAVFVWYAVVAFEDGTVKQLKGDVTLTR